MVAPVRGRLSCQYCDFQSLCRVEEQGRLGPEQLARALEAGFDLGGSTRLDLQGFFLSGRTEGNATDPELDLSGFDVVASLRVRS